MRFRHTVLAIGGALGALIVATSVAAPADAAQRFKFKDVATGFCLDSNGAKHVYTHSCNGGPYQKWVLHSVGPGVVTMKNVATGFCLDSNAARRVYTHRCNGGAYQKWAASPSPQRRHIIFKDVATGFCLDSNAAKHVYTHRCNGGRYQMWDSVPITT